MGWRRTVIELHSTYSFSTSAFGPPPPFCKYGPGNPEVHCLTGETGDIEANMAITSDDEALKECGVPCPYAAYGRARSTIVLTDGLGEHDDSAEFCTREDLSREQWNEASANWRGDWRKIIDQSVDSDIDN